MNVAIKAGAPKTRSQLGKQPLVSRFCKTNPIFKNLKPIMVVQRIVVNGGGGGGAWATEQWPRVRFSAFP